MIEGENTVQKSSLSRLLNITAIAGALLLPIACAQAQKDENQQNVDAIFANFSSEVVLIVWTVWQRI